MFKAYQGWLNVSEGLDRYGMDLVLDTNLWLSSYCPWVKSRLHICSKFDGSEFLRNFILGANRSIRFKNSRKAFISCHVVHILHMSAQVTALCKRPYTFGTFIWPLTGVFPEVVTKITTLLKDTIAAVEFAFEEEFDALGQLVLDLDRFVPLIWNTGKSLYETLLIFPML